MNLSKVVGNFMEEQKAVNAQANKRIDTVESTLNKKMDNLQTEISQKYDNLQYSISMLTNQQQVQEKGKFPSQTLPNPRGVHEVSSSNDLNPIMDEFKAIITLRNGKEFKQPIPKPTEECQEVKEAEPDEVVTTEPAVKNSTPPPFQQALKAKKKVVNQAEILEVLSQVKVNIPQLDKIKQVPT